MSDQPDPTSTPEAQPPAKTPSTTPSTVPPVHPQPTNGLAVAALVLGILAFLSGWFFMGILLGVAAIILGVIGLKKPGGRGLAIAGIVTGSIGALGGIFFTILFFVALSQVGNIPDKLSDLNNALAQQNKATKDQINAKKDFTKGQTGIFGTFEVKVNSVQRNFTPENQFSRPSEGKEFIVINVSVKNTDTETRSFSTYDLKVNENGVSSGSSYIESVPVFDGGSLSKGATATGNIVYEVTTGATALKLQYEEFVYDFEVSKTKTLTYTLEI